MNKLSGRTNFVITSRQPWEEKQLGSNIRDMARTLSEHHSVLFVNEPLDWSARLSKKSGRAQRRDEFVAENQGKHLFQAEPNLWVLSPQSLLGSFNWLPDTPLYDWANRYNGTVLSNEIKLAVKELGWKSFVLINDNDMLQGFYLKELLKPAVYVYYLRDNFLAVDFWKRHGERLEPLLMSKVDLVASNSLYLANQAARYNPRSVYVGQGCDLKMFDPAAIHEIPADMAAIPYPRIGYAGALTGLRLDGGLIETVARQRPDWQVVLIGATDDSFPTERLKALPNVTFLGSKSPHQIPAYLAAMDVLINPQVLNEVTIGNYPRKIDEYLAMGKPVVAGKTETMALFDQHVYLAENAEQFVARIADVLNGKILSSPDERIAFAWEHTWANSVGALTDAIDQLLVSQPQTI
ncbi:glycosyltransferase [Larkinella humicola]|uniref:Glycosyltransferase family 1 protein n=1 Tax=Larkinella humicola TaxID=2607654 RepID=A0A5N1JMC6_9BACT|nr:glycosyltransferase [Larkinella humicola]KAA9357645.1 glycosyltransferase family 1 protein [Larkinella humicola]